MTNWEDVLFALCIMVGIVSVSTCTVIYNKGEAETERMQIQAGNCKYMDNGRANWKKC